MVISWNTIPTFCGMFFPKQQFTEERLWQLMTELVLDNPYRFEDKRGLHDGLRRATKKLAEEKDWARPDLCWEYPTTGSFAGARVTQFNVGTWKEVWNTPKFEAKEGQRFLTLWTWDNIESPTKGDRPLFLTTLYRRAINIMQPDFAWLDHFGKQVFRNDRREVDLRQFAWGATCYGPELVEAIGEDRLRSCPAYKVEKLPWGAYWVQLAENPFTVDQRAKQVAQKHLGLKDLFNDPDGPRQLMPEGDIRITS